MIRTLMFNKTDSLREKAFKTGSCGMLRFTFLDSILKCPYGLSRIDRYMLPVLQLIMFIIIHSLGTLPDQ